MLKVGVTGGIGSGKSTVCRIFECLGVPVFRSDDMGRLLLAEDTDVIEQVSRHFEDVVFEGKIDRKRIAEIVFKDPAKLATLNSIIHPAVRKKFGEWADTYNESIPSHAPMYIINEAAILLETGAYRQFDYMVLIAAPEQLRMERVMQRDHIDGANFKARMRNQWSDEEKGKIANFTIFNDETTPLIPAVLELHSFLSTINTGNKL